MTKEVLGNYANVYIGEGGMTYVIQWLPTQRASIQASGRTFASERTLNSRVRIIAMRQKSGNWDTVSDRISEWKWAVTRPTFPRDQYPCAAED